jgi:hypothetical protein
MGTDQALQLLVQVNSLSSSASVVSNEIIALVTESFTHRDVVLSANEVANSLSQLSNSAFSPEVSALMLELMRGARKMQEIVHGQSLSPWTVVQAISGLRQMGLNSNDKILVHKFAAKLLDIA